MLHEERRTYDTLKALALESYFDGCRDIAIGLGRSHAQVMGYVSSSFPDGFELPVEDLMWKVILLVLSGGMHREIEDSLRLKIGEKISSLGLDDLLSDVTKKEGDALRQDLQILRLI
ncbi:hypothetical protein [Paraburkholderia sp. 22B1P]|jgi:hypothetical protein|uniref:hypothetical protein n=1 Tax=Paraburkholderia sp. 22B1P TaxID=3080498 RepID=UPI003090CF0F|nr:Imm2 family immunity protein [Paraburkholderia sp. 22B1P]